MKKNLRYALIAIICGLWSAQASALEQKDGVYQIGTPQDLVDFSALVNLGEVEANAVLTSDIDMTPIEDFEPIGSVITPYKGTFDGQEHSIKNLWINRPEEEYVGLFGVLNGGAYIKNLIMDELCEVSGKCFVGGIAGGTNGGGTVTFENCGNMGMVGAQEQNAAGIIGVSMGSQCGIKLIHCFNTGGVAGGRESAALCGWVGDNGSEITNCYNAGWVSGVDGSNTLWRNGNGKGTGNFDSYGMQGASISDNPADLESGAVTYLMNGNQSENVIWYQKIGEDKCPMPFASRGIIYAVGDLYCDGTSKGGDATFSNSNDSNRDPHQFVDGVCSVCGEVDTDYLPLTDGYYVLTTAKELNWFAALVNRGNKKVNARLGADIDFSAYTQQDVMIGGNAFEANENEDASSFEGIFDGQGHKITVNYNVSYDGVALFKVIRNATIRNLMVDGSIESTLRFIGGLAYVSRGITLIENVVVGTNIISSYEGDGTHGGMVAVCHESPTFRSCAFVGSMNAPACEGSAAIIGYAHGSVETVIENCYVAPSLLALTGNSTVIARHVDNVINCYYTDNVDFDDDRATIVSPDILPTGELCYTINDAAAIDTWRQDLGTDAYPVPFSSHAMVYVNGRMNCDGTLSSDVSYSNTQTEPTRDEHQYVNDICTVCGARIIRNAEQLVALANDINDGVQDGNIIVDMLSDIDLSGYNYEGIGTRYTEQVNDSTWNDVVRPFMGTFDGHGHKVSNMIIDTEVGNKGLFGVINGATIKNVTVDSSCEIYTTGYAAGIVGTSVGRGVVYIENCGNEAMVNVGGEGANGAGILGVNDLSQSYVHIINCYNTGEIIGQRECGAISGWLGDHFEVVNCYNSGMVADGAVDRDRTFARYNGSDYNFPNCYEVNGRQVEPVSEDDVMSGKLCYMLNQGAGETVYYQTLGDDLHPVLDATHQPVGMENGQYVNAIETIGHSVHNAAQGYYDLQGRKTNAHPRHGVYLVREGNGTTKKVLVK